MNPVSGMTGFGRAEGARESWAWTIEARSVNGRSLDVRARAPSGFDGLDQSMRDEARSRFRRGQVTVGVELRKSADRSAAKINGELALSYLSACKWLVEQGAGPPSADGLLLMKGVLDSGDEAPADRSALENAIRVDIMTALDGLLIARRDEGQRLVPVVGRILDRLGAIIERARKESDSQTDAVRDRFVKRVKELGGGDTADIKDRILQEATLLAAKADVLEELDRLEAHLGSARALLKEGGAVGRRLDFLAQEFLREANTLCSKAATLPLTTAGLDLKAVIEQFREQVQNVE